MNQMDTFTDQERAPIDLFAMLKSGTTVVHQKVMDEAENLGRDMFLQKPFDLVTLIEEIQKFLSH